VTTHEVEVVANVGLLINAVVFELMIGYISFVVVVVVGVVMEVVLLIARPV